MSIVIGSEGILIQCIFLLIYGSRSGSECIRTYSPHYLRISHNSSQRTAFISLQTPSLALHLTALQQSYQIRHPQDYHLFSLNTPTKPSPLSSKVNSDSSAKSTGSEASSFGAVLVGTF